MKQTALSTTVFSLIQSGARLSLALLILLLPKCGLCLALYLNVFSVLGISVTKYFPFLMPVLTCLLALNLVIGWIKAKRTGHYFSWLMAVAASLLLFANKIWLDLGFVSWIAMGLLMVSAIMQIWLSRKVCNRDLFVQGSGG